MGRVDDVILVGRDLNMMFCLLCGFLNRVSAYFANMRCVKTVLVCIIFRSLFG